MVGHQSWRDIELQRYVPDPANKYRDRDCAWGVVRQTDDNWAVLLNTPGGVLMPQELKVIAGIMEAGGTKLKLSSRQAPVLLLREEKLKDALRLLEAAGLRPSIVHGSLRNVKACIGKAGCKNARRHDVLELAGAIDKAFYGVKLPWDFKIALSGCSRNCVAANCQCLGFVENRDGFAVYLGGAENEFAPVHGRLIANNVPGEKVVEVVETILKCYIYFAQRFSAEGIVGAKPRLYEIVGKAGYGQFAQALKEVLKSGADGPPGGEVGTETEFQKETTADRDTSARIPGFTKENAFQAFVVINQLCHHCIECKRYKCHLYTAKESIIEASRTGQKFLPGTPPDILDIIRSLPTDTQAFDLFKVHEAFHIINETCDHCRVSEHDSLCAVNVALTAIGCLIRGKQFETYMDGQKKELLK